ncbi:MAG: succinate dehydrogenase cytochrome b subunit [Elusimicrobia bacterium]|nr:succinate dehydrogenase cytochrome b subunit [Elusimicrobiota bacterium]
MQATEAPAAKSCAACDCRAIEFLESSIGKKIMVALAGLFLSFFLVVHLAGNLFLFGGAPAFNHYASLLEHNELLPVAEIGLVVLFLIHILLAIRATWINRAARPVGYAVYRGKGARTAGSKTMIWTGLLLLAFLIVHLKSFRFAPEAVREADLYALVVHAFRNPWYSGFYVLALVGLGVHLSHGIQSGFQTLGLNHPRYTPWIKRLGLALAVLLALGFMSMPIYFGFLGGAK